jgi:hypothetical protein
MGDVFVGVRNMAFRAIKLSLVTAMLATSGLSGLFKILTAALMLLLSTAANATVVTWNLNSPSGTLGNTQSYTDSGTGASITAAGFNINFDNPTALFGKNDGGDETGLGINGGFAHEIMGTYFVRIAVPNLTDFSFQMNSSTDGGKWDVFGSDAPTSGYSLVATGTDESDHILTGANGAFRYYTFVAIPTGNFIADNFLIASVDGNVASVPEPSNGNITGVPEPSTWAMMILGFVGAGFMAYRRRTGALHAA